MDNFVQNISIEEIIPNEFKEVDESTIEFKQLMNSIKRYGIIEPLLVRPNNGKYEILLGNKRFFIAKKLGLQTVPALVRNIDEELYQEYQEINKLSGQKKHNKFINTNPENEQRTSKRTNDEQNLSVSIAKYNNESDNADIINIEELNKKEYNERDEIKMNNNMPENQNIQPQGLNTNQGQVPTFGGRFFPSLEDEPTNMNMGPMNTTSLTQSSSSSPMNNNYIDLTNIEKDNQQPSQNFITQEPNQNLENPTPVSIVQNLQNQLPGNVSNENLQQKTNILNQEPVQQAFASQNPQNLSANFPNIEQPTNNINNNISIESMDAMINGPTEMNLQTPNMRTDNIDNVAKLNESANIPQPMNFVENTTIPQFDMSQNIAPNIEKQEQPANQADNIVPSPLQNNFESPVNQINKYSNEQTVSPTSPIENPINMDVEVNQPLQDINMTSGETNFSQKEITPVLETIKSLAMNLQNFGYKLNIIEDDLPTSARITIEVEK